MKGKWKEWKKRRDEILEEGGGQEGIKSAYLKLAKEMLLIERNSKLEDHPNYHKILQMIDRKIDL